MRAFVFALLGLFAFSALAQPPARSTPPPGVAVPSWNQLDAQQRRDLAEFSDRWDRMPASRRVQVLERYERWRELPPEKREALRDGWRNFREMSPRQREQVRQSFDALRRLPPEEQRRLRGIWQGMNPQQRRAWLKAGGPGVAPPPQ